MPGNRVIPIARAPTAPRCFATRDTWVRYLQSAQDHEKEERRPFVNGNYRPSFAFCKDCDLAHRRQMLAEKKCEFDAYVEARAAEQQEAARAAA